LPARRFPEFGRSLCGGDGTSYEEVVKTFQPYDRVKEPNSAARKAGKSLIAEGKATESKRKTFIYVNNRLEGNALETISAFTNDET
jgi:hypothetical protein